MVLRNLVREARKRAGLTQADLGRRAGVPQSTVARIESGARTPSTDLVERLVRAAGFEIDASVSVIPTRGRAACSPAPSVERPPNVLPTPPAPPGSFWAPPPVARAKP